MNVNWDVETRMTEQEKKILYELVLKELKSGMQVLPNVETLHEMKSHVTKQDLKYWLALFELKDKLWEGGVK